MDKKGKVLILAIFAVLMITGCSTQRVWTYKADPYVKTEPLVNKSVAVAPLADNRENVNHNLIGIGYIPIMPFGWMNLNTPEGGQAHVASGLWLFRPPEDMAKAIAEELNNSGIFKEAFFTNRASEGELNLRANLKSTYYQGKIFTYCMSIYGAYLWLIGFPAGSYGNDLEISFELVEPSTGKVLWNGTYKKDYSKVFWIYAPGADFYYDQLLKDIMKEAIQSLKNKFASTSMQDTRPRLGREVPPQDTRPCADDIAKFCKDEKPGIKQARCLRDHERELSPACRARIAEVRKRMGEIHQACKQDVEKFCIDINPQSGLIIRCLRTYESELSPECREKISQR